MNEKVKVDLETILKEAFQYIKSTTNIKIVDYKIINSKIILDIEGNSENIIILKDRLNVKENTNLLADNKVDKLKKSLDKLIRTNFNDSFTIKFKSIDDTDKNIIHIALQLKLDSIPYPIILQYHLASDGSLNVSYMVVGDKSKYEIWRASSVSSKQLIKVLKEIKLYYNKGD